VLGRKRRKEKPVRRNFVLKIGLVLLMCSSVSSLAQQKPLTNADVVNMVKGGLAESVVISAIQLNPANYDISPTALLALKKAGVTEQEQAAMLAAMKATAAPPAPQPGTQTAPTPQPAESQPAAGSPAGNPQGWRMPTVSVTEGAAARALPLEKAQLAQTKTKPSSMSSLASDSVVTQALQGGINTASYGLASKVSSPVGGTTVQEAGSIFSGMMARRKPTVTYVWGVAGPASANVLQNYLPVFTVNFVNAPGIAPEDYEPAIIKLTPAQNTCRIVGATQGKEDAQASAAADWQVYSSFLEERVAVNPEKSKPGEYRVTPRSPLLPGEYAVVLRPVSKSKKFSGGDVARGQGDGLVFDGVWSFEIVAAQ
jgi:hypothetical protein